MMPHPRSSPILLLLLGIGLNLSLVDPVQAMGCSPAAAKKKAKGYRLRMELRFDKHCSGIGAKRVEKKMIRFLARQVRRANGRRCEKTYERLFARSLKRWKAIKKVREKWESAFLGRWEITFDDGQVRYFHFPPDFASGDFMVGEWLHTQFGFPVFTFEVAQKFHTIRFLDCDPYFRMTIDRNNRDRAFGFLVNPDTGIGNEFTADNVGRPN